MLILGAFALFLGFLMLNQDAAALFQTLADDIRYRYLGGEPLSDLLMIVSVVAAVASMVLMLFWPRFEPPKQQVVVRHYFGHAHATSETEPAGHSLRIPLLRYYLTAIAQVRRVRAYLGLAA